MRFLARLSLVMLLSLGLLLPRVSVMLADLSGARHVMLCDGGAMVVLSSEDGQATRIAHSDPCALLAVDLPAVPDAPRIGQAPAGIRYLSLRSQRAPDPPGSSGHRPRAPPAAWS